jgi:hypothetical protein
MNAFMDSSSAWGVLLELLERRVLADDDDHLPDLMPALGCRLGPIRGPRGVGGGARRAAGGQRRRGYRTDDEERAGVRIDPTMGERP